MYVYARYKPKTYELKFGKVRNQQCRDCFVELVNMSKFSWKGVNFRLKWILPFPENVFEEKPLRDKAECKDSLIKKIVSLKTSLRKVLKGFI